MNTAAPDTRLASSAAPSNDRLSHLFRASLKQGRVHPLYLPLVRYRQAGAKAAAG